MQIHPSSPPLPTSLLTGYYEEGFLTLQRAVDLSLTAELSGGSEAVYGVDMRLKRFPVYDTVYDQMVPFLKENLPIIVMFSFIVIAPVICNEVLAEKANKLKVFV